MRGIIAEFGGRYLFWSESLDAPQTTLMTRNEIYEFVLQEQGYDGLKELDSRMERVDKYGSSSRVGSSKEALLQLNRAGPHGSHVQTEEEMVRLYGGARAAHWRAQKPSPDLSKPLEMFDAGGFDPVLIPIKEVLCIKRGAAMVSFSLPGHTEEVPVLIREIDGKVLNEGYKYLYVRNVRDAQASAEASGKSHP